MCFPELFLIHRIYNVFNLHDFKNDEKITFLVDGVENLVHFLKSADLSTGKNEMVAVFYILFCYLFYCYAFWLSDVYEYFQGLPVMLKSVSPFQIKERFKFHVRLLILWGKWRRFIYDWNIFHGYYISS